MSYVETEIESLTNFKRQTATYLKQLRETGAPVVLTVNGRAEVVVQDAAAYRRLVQRRPRSNETRQSRRFARHSRTWKPEGRSRHAKRSRRWQEARYPCGRNEVPRPIDGQGRTGRIGCARLVSRSVSGRSGAKKWFARLMACIDKLENMPERCGLAAEAKDLGLEIRELHLAAAGERIACSLKCAGGSCTFCVFGTAPRDAVTRGLIGETGVGRRPGTSRPA